MKKILKNKIILIVILCIISCGIGVYAATTYKASEVVYNSSDGTSMSVTDALNELYQNSKTGGYVGLMYSTSKISPTSKNIAVVDFNQNYGSNTSTSITLTKKGKYRIIIIAIHNPKKFTYTTSVRAYLNENLINENKCKISTDGAPATSCSNFIVNNYINTIFTVNDSPITIKANYITDYSETNDGIHGGYVIIIKE